MWGSEVDLLLNIAEQTGKMPEALLAKPKLGKMASYYLDWFQELAASRRYNQTGPESLSTFDIECFRRVFEIPGKDDFHFYMRAIDELWLAEARKKLKVKT